MIAGRLRTVSWSNKNHLLVWFDLFTGTQPSHLPQQLCNQKDTQEQIDLNSV